jgi:hypothetical protein
MLNDATRPPMPWAQIADTLEQFFNHLEVDGPGGAEEAVRLAAAADPGARIAALDHFRQVFTDVPGRDYDPGKDGSPEVWNGLAALILEVSPDERQRFMDEVLFEVAPPSTYDFLADAIRLLVPLDELVSRIVDRLDNGTDRQQANALAMQYELFGRSSDQRLGDERRRKIADAVDRLRRTGLVGPEARTELSGFSVPEDAAN